MIGPTLCEPLTAFVPDQPPDAVHAVTLVPAQMSVVVVLGATPGGFADNVTDGVPASTVTVAVCDTLPPLPAQASVKLEFAVSVPVLWLPEVPFAPNQAPDAVQLVTLVAVQDKLDAFPDCTLVGNAVSVNVGAVAFTVTAAVCDADPPAPVHVSV